MKKNKTELVEKNTSTLTEIETKNESKIKGKTIFFSIVLLIFAGLIITFIYYIPLIFPIPNNKAIPVNSIKTTEQSVSLSPKETITEVKYIIPESISNALNRLEDKVAKIENLTNQYMNIKADSSAVISMGERLDHIEKKINNLKQLSNDGAIILTTALMIRESVQSGQPIYFEAQILKQLSASQPDIKEAVDYVYNNASRQYPSDKSLIVEYNLISQQMINDLNNQGNWKERLLRKINEYIHISGNENNNEIANKINTIKVIKSYVDNGQFPLAVEELSKSKNLNMLENAKLKEWYQTTASKIKFNTALSEIYIYSLSLMKTQEIKNKNLP